MGRGDNRAEEGGAGAPEWMVTFSDCMTLLLTFFVLLLSFSSFDDKDFRKANLFFYGRSPSLNTSRRNAREAAIANKQIQVTAELNKGSEKPTLSKSKKSRQTKQPPLVDFRNRRVFTISSKRVFWGKGVVISSQGRVAFSSLAAFFSGIPNRIVISEVGGSNEQSRLSRAWAVIQYLTSKEGLDSGRFSISASGFTESQAEGQVQSGGDMVEIVLLERSINN